MGDEQFTNRHALRVTFRQTRRGAPSYCKRASSVLTRKLKHPSRTPPPPELNGLLKKLSWSPATLCVVEPQDRRDDAGHQRFSGGHAIAFRNILKQRRI